MSTNYNDHNLDKEIEAGLTRAEQMIRRQRLLWGLGIALALLAAAGISGVFFYFVGASQSPQVVVEKTVEVIITATLPLAPAFTSTLTHTSTPAYTSMPDALPADMTDEKGVQMRPIPAGEFTMGGNSYSDEQPIHTVRLPDYYMDVYEVTNARYKACVEAGGCTPPADTSRYNDTRYVNHPVVNVTWNDAKTYCEWRGARLPTEAEWEKAARGTDARTYPWGSGIDCQKANYAGCVSRTSLVGSYPQGVSPYGLYDMAGNAWEWVADWYSDTYYGTLGENAFDPQGPTSGKSRVVRGGAWIYSDYLARSAYRGGYAPGSMDYFLGFRCALSP